ncbi:hypothetical protein AB0M36_17950 [Actinoplanes sp. NPDC051346]|uniref:endonuclease toxin domain-containing protein n=1 Tax=Actinoplanes sp. NPDC051346 TaxID=3155048 RepID=UPI003419A957
METTGDSGPGTRTAGVSGPRGRRTWVIGLAIALVVLLIGGLAAWRAWPGGPGREPFERAIANLSKAEAVTYRTSIAGVRAESRVTRHGDSLGTLALAGQEFRLLSVGGKTYLKTPSGLLPGTGEAGMGLRNRWVSGKSLATAGQSAITPRALADTLSKLVDEADEFTEAAVGGTAAYRAHATAGDLYVSRAEPNQVLRYTPAVRVPSLPSIPNLPPRPSRSATDNATSPPALPSIPALPPIPDGRSLPPLPDLPDLPDLPGTLLRAWLHGPAEPPAAPRPAGEMDVEAMGPEQVDSLYGELEDAATELVDAADPQVRFNARTTGQIACGGACTVNAAVTSDVSGAGDTTVVDSQVTATMTATVSVDGTPAGLCVSAPTPVPANGTGTVTCSDAASGAMARARLAQKRAAAKSGVVTVAITAQVQIQATAMTTAQVKQEVERLRNQRQEAAAGRAPPAVPAEGLKAGRVDLGTRQAGTAAPVRVQGLQNPWKSPQDRFTIEDALGGNLPPRSKGIDVYTSLDGGTAISIKTIDPRATSYRTSEGLGLMRGQVRQQIDDLYHYRTVPDRSWGAVIRPDDISVWVFRLAYPRSAAKPEFLAMLEEMIGYGAKKNIIVHLVPIDG